ncbi:hypothetical protein NDU88_001640 [Pleurodeles waltl]|uniref:Uncharacterized protein n=1 Tax=Pleurodeles waltl TaxID=8319 RepID=A0AAV7WIX6_PLEWA|nr:hypothetical protein NDU88_001640 [Pleurodeles waltl]
MSIWVRSVVAHSRLETEYQWTVSGDDHQAPDNERAPRGAAGLMLRLFPRAPIQGYHARDNQSSGQATAQGEEEEPQAKACAPGDG